MTLNTLPVNSGAPAAPFTPHPTPRRRDFEWEKPLSSAPGLSSPVETQTPQAGSKMGRGGNTLSDRTFKDGHSEWKWTNGRMLTRQDDSFPWHESIFVTVAELLECMDVVETTGKEGGL